jgi:tagatose 6-phosphate kinase
LITVLCANAGVDKTYEIANFAAGGYYHPGQVLTVAGGKGINVARVLAMLGQSHRVTGFAGGNNGRFITRQLIEAGSHAELVKIAEESRVTISVIDRVEHTETRVDEVGALVTPGEVGKLTAKWRKLLGSSEMAIISGSAPRGVTKELYAELAQMARQAKVPLILDAHGEMLSRALPSRPMMIKPNLSEMQQLMRAPLTVPDGVVAASRELLDGGLSVVMVTLGARGAIGVTESHGIWWAKPPKVSVVSAVGSGDAFLAGFAAASMERKDFGERMRLATACGAANASSLGAGQITREKVEEILPEVQLERLDAEDAEDPPSR